MKKLEILVQAKKYYTEIFMALENYETEAMLETENFERMEFPLQSDAEEPFFTLGSEQVPLITAVIVLGKLLRRPKYNSRLVGFSISMEEVGRAIGEVEKFLFSLPGAKLPKCPKPVNKLLGEKRFEKKEGKKE